MAKPQRVSLLVDDAITALVALGRSIERLDERIAEGAAAEVTLSSRAENWAAYQRIAQRLGVPTDTLRKQPS